MDNINWDDLIYSIQEKETILLLGPDLLKNGEGKVLQDMLYQKLALDNADKIHDYDDHEGFFLFKSGTYKGLFIREIKKFYRDMETPELLQLLVQIPFHVIINTTPDLLLKSTFEKYKLETDFHYFSHNEPDTEIAPPTPNKPLIYNLFGTLDKEESIILSDDDLFKYLQAILGKKSIPQSLKNLFQSAKELIFLGFRFDKWYVQLMLRIFELEKDEGAFSRIASGVNTESKLKGVVLNQFKINFVDTNIDDFIKTLYQRCTESKNLVMRKLTNAEELAKKMGEIEKEGQKIIEEKLNRLNRLLADYEMELIIATDPTQKMNFEYRIKGLKEKIEEAKEELKQSI